jgi:hypothetical protein
MVVINHEKLVLYDAVGNESSKVVHNFSDIKEIFLVKDEADINHTLEAFDYGDPNKVGAIFHLKFKTERGGIIIEPDPSSVQKWDYMFFIVNLILSNSISPSLSFRPLSTETNMSKLTKTFNYKALDAISIKRLMGFDYEFPIEEAQVLQDVEDRLVDWQILDRCAALQHETLFKKIGDRVKKASAEEGNTKSTQTEIGKGLGGISEGRLIENDMNDTHAHDRESKRKIVEFNYTVPSLSAFINTQKELLQSIFQDYLVGADQGDARDSSGKLGEDGVGQDQPSPQVELDLSLESVENEESIHESASKPKPDEESNFD